MTTYEVYDPEAKGGFIPERFDEKRHHSVIAPDESGAVHGESFEHGNSTYAKLQRLVGRYGIEQRGIERVPEDERTDKNQWKVGTMWCAANMGKLMA